MKITKHDTASKHDITTKHDHDITTKLKKAAKLILLCIVVIAAVYALHYKKASVKADYGLPQTAQEAVDSVEQSVLSAETASERDMNAAEGTAFGTDVNAAEETASGTDMNAAEETASGTDMNAAEETASGSENIPAAKYNSYDKLSVPTFIGKIGTDYFIGDCYNNQIIYSSSLDAPLTKWKVMTNSINKGHTVVSDGQVYLADDTENNRVLVFVKKDTGFVQTQTFENIGNKPHYMQYDAATDAFYCWSSFTDEMYIFKRKSGSSTVYIADTRTVEGLENRYIRSFMIAGNLIYIVSGIPIEQTEEKPYIYCCELDSFKVLERFEVPNEIAGMAQIMNAGKYFYITVSTDLAGSQDAATIIRTRSLSDLSDGKYEDIYSKYFAGGGTPYYMGCIDGKYYLTEHRLQDHAIWSFDITDDEITNVKTLF